MFPVSCNQRASPEPRPGSTLNTHPTVADFQYEVRWQPPASLCGGLSSDNKLRTKRQSPGLQRVRSGEYLNYSEHPYLPPAAFGEWIVSLCRKRFMQNPRVLCTALYNGTCSCVLLPFLLTTPGAFMRHGSWCAVWSSGNLWRHSRNMR